MRSPFGFGHTVDASTNRGRRVAMDAGGVAGALLALPTALISVREQEPRQWVVTFAPAVATPNTVNPWARTADAPSLGDSSVLRASLRWGAGAAAFTTEFDYPVSGCAFGVLADALDLKVRVATPSGGTVPTFATSTPIVGAFAVEGQATDAAPLRWLEPPRLASGAIDAPYLVRPFARTVRLAADEPATNSGWQIAFDDAAGNSRWLQRLPSPLLANVVVPSSAVNMRVISIGAPALLLLTAEWQIGLT